MNYKPAENQFSLETLSNLKYLRKTFNNTESWLFATR